MFASFLYALATNIAISWFACCSMLSFIFPGAARMLFVKLPYTLATEEAERIGLDHVARISTNTDTDTSRAVDTLLAQHSAIKMLASRVKIVLEYVKAVERGELEHNHEIMRQIRALSHRYVSSCHDIFMNQRISIGETSSH